MAQGKLYWLHTLSGLHVGAGTGVGFVDQPVIRERITEWPYVPGTSVKGVVAASFDVTDDSRKKQKEHAAAFGVAPSGEVGEYHQYGQAGALVFSDARLVCLPVTSFYGTFAWVTCRLALERLTRDLDALGVKGIPGMVPADGVGRTATSKLVDGDKKIYLEDNSDLTVESRYSTEWAAFLAKKLFPAESRWIQIFEERFVVVPDDRFKHFGKYACEVVPRIKIDPGKKTVEKGKFWLEELVPAEAVFAGVVWCDPAMGVRGTDSLKKYCSDRPILQFGGKATTGRGRTQLVYSD